MANCQEGLLTISPFMRNVRLGITLIALSDLTLVGGRLKPTIWGNRKEHYNGAKSLIAMCAKILEYDGEFYWERKE